RELAEQGAAVPQSLALSSDGRLALTGGPKTEPALKLWDTDTGKPLRRLFGHDTAVTAVAISPDDRLRLSAREDRTIGLWELATGRELRRFDGFATAPQAVAFTPDGRTAVAVGGDHTVWLAEVASGRTRVLTGHHEPACCLAVSADGSLLATAT